MINKSIYLTVKDYSVSGEKFQLLHNLDLDMLETHPQPKLEKLSEYYKSEDYISHTDTKRNLFERVYRIVRKVALKNKINLINSFNTDAKDLLDIGCGTGDFLEVAQRKGWNVTGIEPNEGARKIANSKTKHSVYNSDYLDKLRPESFDVITLWHVLEHLPNLEMHIALLRSLVKPDGIIVIAVPNFKSYDAKYYKKYWAAYDVPRHLWHFSKVSISHLFKKEKLQLVKILPMVYDAYYVSLLSEKYKSEFMNPIKAFWIGFKSNYKARTSKEYSSHIYLFTKS